MAARVAPSSRPGDAWNAASCFFLIKEEPRRYIQSSSPWAACAFTRARITRTWSSTTGMEMVSIWCLSTATACECREFGQGTAPHGSAAARFAARLTCVAGMIPPRCEGLTELGGLRQPALRIFTDAGVGDAPEAG